MDEEDREPGRKRAENDDNCSVFEERCCKCRCDVNKDHRCKRKTETGKFWARCPHYSCEDDCGCKDGDDEECSCWCCGDGSDEESADSRKSDDEDEEDAAI